MDESHELDLAKADRSIWLMKAPVVVAKAWGKHVPSSSSSTSSFTSDANNMAKVVLSVDPLRADISSPEFTMEMVGAEYGNMPKCYALNMFKDFVPMDVFSVVDLGKSPYLNFTCLIHLTSDTSHPWQPYPGEILSICLIRFINNIIEQMPSAEGKIENKFDMKPHGEDIEEYARLCRERTSKASVKNRQIQVIDNDRGVHMRPMPGMLGLVSSNSKEKRKPPPVKQTEVKRTRRDRGELEAIMFKLFEGQPNWTLKQLVQETDQPAQFLKEILNELCVYNKRGSNQGTYELKPEYKKAAEDDTAGK